MYYPTKYTLSSSLLSEKKKNTPLRDTPSPNITTHFTNRNDIINYPLNLFN